MQIQIRRPGSNRSTIRRSGVALAATLLGLSGVLAACAEDSAGGDAAEDASDGSLSLVTAGATANQMIPYLADVLGYAEEEGLDLDVKSVEANVLSVMVGGRADVAHVGVGVALAPVNDGKETSIIYALGKGSATASVAGSAEVDSIEDCKRMAGHQRATAAYSSAVALREATGAGYEIIEFTTPSDVVSATVSGQTDCIVSSLGVIKPGLDQGLKVLIDARDESALPPGSVQDVVGVSLWGMTETLQANREDVEKLVRAVDKVRQYLASTDPAEVAAALMEHSDFSAYDAEVLAANIEVETPFMFPNEGRVDENMWTPSIEFYTHSMDFLDPAKEEWSYQSRVDMSYYDGALDG